MNDIFVDFLSFFFLFQRITLDVPPNASVEVAKILMVRILQVTLPLLLAYVNLQ